MRRTIVLGGGTFEPIRNHLSLCAPAFGSTAKMIHAYLLKEELPVELVLTQMAYRQNSHLKSNEDVEKYVDTLLEDETVGTIVLNVAFCDFKSLPIDGVEPGFHAERLMTSNGNVTLELTPADKVIAKIRKKRPDIFLVGFKTTTNKSSEEQFKIALKMMKSVKCNLVLANDTVTRNNMIITAEETIYGETINRLDAILELSEMIKMRANLTYHRSTFEERESYPMANTHKNFQTVVKFLIDNGGFIENNGNGFTPGHFCYKPDKKSFYSSQRKANHNLVFEEGMSLVVKDGKKMFVYGKRKASVGATSQWMILEDNPNFDCIIHTHNPLKSTSMIPVTPQKPFQCGSIECGMNTVNNMGSFTFIKRDEEVEIRAVYLDKHGANILFKSQDDPQVIIDFIKDNLELGTKVK